MERDLEHDIKALADRARAERDFAVELYGALCNAEWRQDDGSRCPGGSWRYSADVVAHLRGHGEDYLELYCSGGEGKISARVAGAMARLGWHVQCGAQSCSDGNFNRGVDRLNGGDVELASCTRRPGHASPRGEPAAIGRANSAGRGPTQARR